MTRIIRSGDCGNSPKNKRAEDLAVALATADLQTVTALTTDDVEWRIVGGSVYAGQEAVRQALAAANADAINTLTVLHVVTHGKAGAVDGVLQFASQTTRFADFFDFSSAKGTHINQITSYRVHTQPS